MHWSAYNLQNRLNVLVRHVCLDISTSTSGGHQLLPNTGQNNVSNRWHILASWESMSVSNVNPYSIEKKKKSYERRIYYSIIPDCLEFFWQLTVSIFKSAKIRAPSFFFPSCLSEEYVVCPRHHILKDNCVQSVSGNISSWFAIAIVGQVTTTVTCPGNKICGL